MRTYIIAEAGVNHNGDLELAKKMVTEAKKAGADCIKFQTFKSENVVSKNAKKADYQKVNMKDDDSQLEMIKKLELPLTDFKVLKDYCKEKQIDFLSTPFDMDAIAALEDLGMDTWKIPSGEITNYPFLVRIGKLAKKVIMSTGMSYMDEIAEAIEILNENGTNDIVILHCTTEYPAPYKDINLNVIKTIRDEFGYEVGYSDHSKGIEVSLAAVALGATIIEKHFTLDKNMEGPDHIASLNPEELRQLVESIRIVEESLGSNEKFVTPSEENNRLVARKSIVASKKINKGDVFSEKNITTKRPGTGLSPMKWNEIIKKKASENYEEDELIVE